MSTSSTPVAREQLLRLFAGLVGAFFGVCLLKFGNPPIFEKWVAAPQNGFEFIFNFPWPIGWAYTALFLLCLLGLPVARWKLPAPGWLIALPLLWLVWQFFSASLSMDANLSTVTVKHFVACVACFYLGLFSLSRVKRMPPLWIALFLGFLLVLAIGWQQHFGGLQETRRYFRLYHPNVSDVPPELIKKINSDRIFGTMFYPNALAGMLLLLMPPLLGVISKAQRAFTPSARGLIIVLTAVGGLGCLYWSGSKGGWLLMLLLGLVALLRLPFRRQYKLAVLGVVLLAGLTGFFLKYAGFFQHGATSVSARFEYWNAAAQTTLKRPVFGSGPGTFYLAHEAVRKSGSEASRLVHNDYLEQASDSGIPGFLLFTGFVLWALWWTGKGFWKGAGAPANVSEALSMEFLVWLGVLGFCLQSFLEFGLYIPALAWPAFAFLGWLLGISPEPSPKS